MAKPRLSEADIACWVIKSRLPPETVVPGWQLGSQQRLTRCLRRSYRVELMRPGQRCLLWLSGADRPGIHAIGSLNSEAEVRLTAVAERPESEVELSFRLLRQWVARPDLQADPVFARAEVLRMPAGSNPSYLAPEQLDALRDHLNPAEWRSAGW